MSDLHPQVLDLLASMSAIPPQPWEVPIEAYRAAGEKLINLAGEPNPLCCVQDMEVPLPGRVLHARRYYPKGAVGPVPCVVYFHGGGFIRGGLDSHDRLCREVSVQGDLCVVSVAYRLAPENPYPAAHVDAVESFRWIADHHDDLRIDRGALAVAGDSSGGMLAAIVAAKLGARTGGALVRAQGILCPVLDLTLGGGSVARYAAAPLLSRKALQWCIEQYVPDVGLRSSPEVSPLFGNLADCPPTVVVSAEIDPVADDASRYVSTLNNSGGEASWREYSGMPHSFFLLSGALDEGRRAVTEFSSDMSNLLR
ncbi:alpha/beta hydrolase [Gordonia sp. HY442]|uniref:alpha/beta hydrolase n=1 Tax=Gordonia zhenghanii TaxID=2911516 RepID=UPI001F311BDF|nr:alpha/beta hydrolase [Gordonia zhenghanii]MCF8607568.1 alpha/beta hydrolase [Gordonia zhenghanii]